MKELLERIEKLEKEITSLKEQSFNVDKFIKTMEFAISSESSPQDKK